ncbi:MAG: hypothetical protein JXR70_10985 [Spirochaetales bacterium]|nr:hypothetical protein [Spirochaetales bacterium]
MCKNPSFENIGNNSRIHDWDTSAWVDTKEARLFSASEEALEGEHSGLIMNKVENHCYYIQTIDVKENAKYEITVFAKTKNVGTDRKGATLDVANVLSAVGDLRGDTDWTKIGMYLETRKGIHSIQIMLALGYFGSLNTGTVWFDQVQVKELEQFSENYPKSIIQVQDDFSKISQEANVNQTVADKVKETLDLFSIVSSLIIFLGTLLYLVFYVHKDRPLPEINTSDNINIQPDSSEAADKVQNETTENQEPIE